MANIRILLADDHAIVRAGIRGFLEHAGDIEGVAEAEAVMRAVSLGWVAQSATDIADD